VANISEVAPVVIDPRHERYGQIGEMTFSGWMGDGTCLIKFDDGEELSLNDGWISGVTQFAALRKCEPEQISRLVDALPSIRPQLEELYGQIVEPMKQPPTPETSAVRTGAVALINSVIKPEMPAE
jgi:hypothetical protein